MKIAIDVSQIIYKGTGVSRYLNNLIQALLKYDDKNEYVFFFSSLRGKLDPKLRQAIKKRQLKEFLLPVSFLELIWNRWHVFPIDNLIGKVDIILTSDWIEPPSFTKKITIVHDLVFLKFPETLPSSIIDVQKRRFRWIKKESSLIIADSFNTKNDLIELFKIDEKKIEVVYPAVELLTTNEEQNVVNKYGIAEKFILTVGKIEPRKNIERLINAFVKAEFNDVELIIVGEKGWGKLKAQSLKFKTQNIRFLGFVPDEDLYALYKNALFFAYPSIYEGFGYPVVEAMKIGCPVATSNSSSLKEIGKDSCLLFNPFSEKEMVDSLTKMAINERLRKELAAKGKQKAKEFSLQNFSFNLIKCFNRVYDNWS